MAIDCVIFDLDGTLLDTLDDLTAAVNHALTAFSLAPITKARACRFVGDGVKKLIERAVYFATVGSDPGPGEADCDKSLVNACLTLFTKYYDEHSNDRTAPYAGVTDMLLEVKNRGLKSAIVTNKYHQAALSLKNVFFPTVDVIIGAQNGIRPKPAPDGVYRALELLHSDVAHAVYMGDGETDMKTAKACGMPVVAVTWGFRDKNTLMAFSPDIIIDSPVELIDALRRGGLIA